ncbi:MAG: radical SAM protein [Nitrospirota bacterium]
MGITRREFLVGSLFLGGSLLLAPHRLLGADGEKKAWHPAYGRLEDEGNLGQRIDQAYACFSACELCPRRCGVNRTRGEHGFCRASTRAVVYSAQAHFGEEVALVGNHGSGTIFFSHCNLRCVFCQNWPISHEGRGRQIEDQELAEMMIHLQRIGCHNINLVTPTHMMPNILKATQIAYRKGLRLPLVYNTSGYERVEILKLLDGIVDIYLPDMKYMDSDKSAKYSADASDYPEFTKKAIVEMHRQVGVLQLDDRSIARRGLVIRHLVMPNRVAGTEKFVRWVAETLPKSSYVNIMAQYHVDYKAYDYPEIARAITVDEFLAAMAAADRWGLTNLDPRSVAIRNVYAKQRQESWERSPQWRGEPCSAQPA